MTETSAYTDDK